jgi:hypothetical protein
VILLLKNKMHLAVAQLGDDELLEVRRIYTIFFPRGTSLNRLAFRKVAMLISAVAINAAVKVGMLEAAVQPWDRLMHRKRIVCDDARRLRLRSMFDSVAFETICQKLSDELPRDSSGHIADIRFGWVCTTASKYLAKMFGIALLPSLSNTQIHLLRQLFDAYIGDKPCDSVVFTQTMQLITAEVYLSALDNAVLMSPDMWEHFLDLSGIDADSHCRAYVHLWVQSRRFLYYCKQIFSVLDTKNVGLVELTISEIIQKLTPWLPEVLNEKGVPPSGFATASLTQMLQLRLMGYQSRGNTRNVCMDEKLLKGILSAMVAAELSNRAHAGNLRSLALWELLLDSMSIGLDDVRYLRLSALFSSKHFSAVCSSMLRVLSSSTIDTLQTRNVGRLLAEISARMGDILGVNNMPPLGEAAVEQVLNLIADTYGMTSRALTTSQFENVVKVHVARLYMSAVEINLITLPELWETMFNQLNLPDDAQARLQARTKFGSRAFELLSRTLYEAIDPKRYAKLKTLPFDEIIKRLASKLLGALGEISLPNLSDAEQHDIRLIFETLLPQGVLLNMTTFTQMAQTVLARLILIGVERDLLPMQEPWEQLMDLMGIADDGTARSRARAKLRSKRLVLLSKQAFKDLTAKVGAHNETLPRTEFGNIVLRLFERMEEIVGFAMPTPSEQEIAQLLHFFEMLLTSAIEIDEGVFAQIVQLISAFAIVRATQMEIIPPIELWEQLMDQLGISDDGAARLHARAIFESAKFEWTFGHIFTACQPDENGHLERSSLGTMLKSVCTRVSNQLMGAVLPTPTSNDFANMEQLSSVAFPPELPLDMNRFRQVVKMVTAKLYCIGLAMGVVPQPEAWELFLDRSSIAEDADARLRIRSRVLSKNFAVRYDTLFAELDSLSSAQLQQSMGQLIVAIQPKVAKMLAYDLPRLSTSEILQVITFYDELSIARGGKEASLQAHKSKDQFLEIVKLTLAKIVLGATQAQILPVAQLYEHLFDHLRVAEDHPARIRARAVFKSKSFGEVLNQLEAEFSQAKDELDPKFVHSLMTSISNKLCTFFGNEKPLTVPATRENAVLTEVFETLYKRKTSNEFNWLQQIAQLVFAQMLYHGYATDMMAKPQLWEYLMDREAIAEDGAVRLWTKSMIVDERFSRMCDELFAEIEVDGCGFIPRSSLPALSIHAIQSVAKLLDTTLVPPTADEQWAWGEIYAASYQGKDADKIMKPAYRDIMQMILAAALLKVSYVSSNNR